MHDWRVIFSGRSEMAGTVSTQQQTETPTALPVTFTNKNVWCYWEGQMPPYIRACIASIRHAAAISDAQFALLTPANLNTLDITLPSGFTNLRHAAHRSDVLAAAVLARYGGLFVDADVVFLDQLHTLWNRAGDKNGVLFRNAQGEIAVWGMLVKAQHPAFIKWHDMQHQLLSSCPEEPEWNSLGSTLITDIVQTQPGVNMLILDATTTVQPIAWQQQQHYFGDLNSANRSQCWTRDWQPFVVLNNHMLPKTLKSATEPDIIASQGPLGALLSQGREGKRKLILGLGTGRCGTASFARLLAVNGIQSTHELPEHLHWHYHDKHIAQKHIAKRLDRILARPGRCIADTAFFYLPHVNMIKEYCFEQGVEVRFVALKRDRAATVSSYIGWVTEKNAHHWLASPDEQFTLDPWDACYPSYPNMPLENAIGRYWDEYYAQANEWQQLTPDCFSIISTNALNTAEGLRDIEAIIGERLHQPDTGAVHENAYNTALPVYWINLDRSKDRRANMQSDLGSCRIRHYRVNAVDGKDVTAFNTKVQFGDDPYFLQRAGFRDRNYPISRSEFACSASHIYAIAQAFESGVPYAVICEDDVHWQAEAIDKLKSILARMPKDCTILQLVTIGPPETIRFLYAEYINKGRHVMPREELLERLTSLGKNVLAECQGTQAYIITRRGMSNILAKFWKNNTVYFPITENSLTGSFGAVADELLYHFAQGEQDRTYVFTQPFMTWQDFGSEIHSDHLPEHQRALREVQSIRHRKLQLSAWPVNTYWINREASQSRKHRMQARLERAGLRHSRVVAIDGDNANDVLDAICFDEKLTLPDERRRHPINHKELACTASHYKAIFQAYEDGCNVALILEDDVEPGWLSREWLDALLEQLPADCGIVQLAVVPDNSLKSLEKWAAVSGRSFIKKQSQFSIKTEYPALQNVSIHGASAYLIKRAAMANVLARGATKHQLCLPPLSELANNAAVLADRLIYRDAIGNGLCSYALCHPIVTWETLDSELHPDHLPDHIATKQSSLCSMLQSKNSLRPDWLKLN